MQAQLFCATCTSPLAFTVPDLTGNRCESCGERTALEPLPTEPEELAMFNAAGVYSSR